MLWREVWLQSRGSLYQRALERAEARAVETICFLEQILGL
jgi:hypothetical protein